MISESAKSVLNDPTLIAHRDLWFDRLQNLFDGIPDEYQQDHVFAVGGFWGVPGDPGLIYTDPEAWADACLENLAERAQESCDTVRFRPACIESALYGVHFIDSILGSEVFFQDGQWYNRYLKTEVGSLERPDLEGCPIWQTAKRAALAFVRQEVALPLFGLPTIASTLNIAVNLYGEEILVSMLAEPEKAIHDLGVINDVLCDIHRWYRSVIPERQLQPVVSWARTQPPGYGQICGCTTQLVSLELYEQMVAPLDDRLLGVYPRGGMIHLCGAHTHLIPAFRQMPNLKALQLNDRAADDLEQYYRELREDQLIYLIPYEKMTVEQAMEITGGHRLVVNQAIETPICRH